MITKITADNDREYFAPRFEQITQALAQAATYTEVSSGATFDANVAYFKKNAQNKYEAVQYESAEDFEDALLEGNIYVVAENSEIKPIIINSLESYYANLIAISKLTTRKDVPGKYLLVAPADEPYFEIDANTRTITVPPHFKKNGIGVQGDDEAELIVFKINRYFDYMDFMETKISINWNFTQAGQRLPMYTDIQSQEAFAPDDMLEPGYVVFGFFIKKDMTPSKGTLSFSVTCYRENAGDIVYSFNTQTANVSVNEGLMLEDPSKVENVANKMLSRLSDSAYTPETIAPIQTPEWKLGAIDEENKVLGLPEKMNFNIDNNGIEEDNLEIVTQAYTPGLATMKYTWYSIPENGNVEVIRDSEVVTSPSDYFVSQDEAYDENSTYYLKDDNGHIVTTPITEEEYNQAKEDNKQIFELGSTYKAKGAGRYQVVAQGESITVQNGANIRTVSEPVESNVCLVPPAAKPVVTLEVESTLNNDDNEYTIIDDSEGYKYISADSAPKINAVVTTESEEELGAIAVEVLKDDMITELTAQEIIDNTKTNNNPAGKYDFQRFPGENNGKFQVNAGGVTQEGEYKVRAINRRNHTYSVSEPSDSIKTSFIAPRITAIDVYTIEDNTKIIMLDAGARPAGVDAITGKNVELNGGNNYTRTFVLDDVTPNKYTDAVTSYFVEELVQNSNTGEYELAINSATQTPGRPIHNEGPEGTNDEFEVLYDEDYTDSDHSDDNIGAYVFTISGDSGVFRIRTENRYHGTLRIGYTELFKVTQA